MFITAAATASTAALSIEVEQAENLRTTHVAGRAHSLSWTEQEQVPLNSLVDVCNY